jgi:hypothetical protein
LSLRVTGDTSIAPRHIIHLGRIEDIPTRRVCQVLTAGSVASFTTYIPLCDLLALNVVINGVAAVT